MRILLVEDDYMQSESLAALMRGEFEGLTADILETEFEFYNQFDRIASAGYSLVVLDVMLRWTDPAPNMPEPPDDVQEEGHHWAGLRCLRRLQGDSRTREIPVILYTVYEGDALKPKLPELPANVSVVTKKANGEGFLEQVHGALG